MILWNILRGTLFTHGSISISQWAMGNCIYPLTKLNERGLRQATQECVDQSLDQLFDWLGWIHTTIATKIIHLIEMKTKKIITFRRQTLNSYKLKKIVEDISHNVWSIQGLGYKVYNRNYEICKLEQGINTDLPTLTISPWVSRFQA